VVWVHKQNLQNGDKSMSTPQIPTKIAGIATLSRFPLMALVLLSVSLTGAVAQDVHSHLVTQRQGEAQDQQSALLRIVRQATARFHDVKVAESEGYHLEFGCVSGDDYGAMGLHYVNDTLVGNGIVDATRPQIILYEKQPNGSLTLNGADYLVLADAWDAKHPGVPPQLMGQIFHYFAAPNRFGLPAFYTLHVWAWKDNPNGAFVNWHPSVSCQSFVGQTTP
jgi:hypothetical protein